MCIVPPDQPLAKGVVTFCLDEISRRHNAADLLQLLHSELKSIGDSYYGLDHVLAKYLISEVYDDPEKVEKFRLYLEEFWFDHKNPNVEFKKLQPIAPVYAEGLVKTIEIARSHLIPIDSWWFVDYPAIQMINLVSDRQVTLVIATPRPETMAPKGIFDPKAEAWCTKHVSVEGAVETQRLENRPEN